MFDDLVSNINFLFVFLEGVISFFSPCVIPLIPIYISYLAGNAKQTDENGIIVYKQKKVFFHTLFFILGISFAFFILGISFSALGTFFNTNKVLFTRIGGIIIILLGFLQLGVFNINFLNREHKINIKSLLNKPVNPFIAFIMGFTFSFAWTPCIGPFLSSVLILASSSKNALTGNLLILVYTAGFVIPFLLVGMFTTQLLNFIKSKQGFLKYAIKLGGILLIIIGILTFTGYANIISSYLNRYSSNNENSNNREEKNTIQESTTQESTSQQDTSEQEDTTLEAFDFTLTDQYGNIHTLSDYKGKVVFLNFWATWCPPCKLEMPYIEELYNEYNLNQDDIVILGVANPSSEEYPHNQDVNEAEIKKFLDDNNYTFPVVFDKTGQTLNDYFINSFPTTFMIDKLGNIYGYVQGSLTKDMIINIINQTLEVE